MTYAKGMAVEFAHKTTDGTIIEDALKSLQEGKTTIDEVKELIESGTVSNAKPIYYHPILIQSNLTGAIVFALSIMIINNDPTPFTFETFIKWGEDLAHALGADAIINCSGYYKSASYEVTSISHLLCVPSDDSWRIRGGRAGYSEIINVVYTKANMASLPVQVFNDAVNKIN